MIYHSLDHLMGAYLNQDYELSGNTIEEVVQCFLDAEQSKAAEDLIADCEKFLRHQSDVETDFEEMFGFDFAPRLWGISADAFLNATIEQSKRYLSIND